MPRIPLDYCCPTVHDFLKVLGVEHALEIKSCLHCALLFDFLISLSYGIIWLSNVMQLSCLHCLAYEPLGTVVFFVNAWVAGVLLTNFDDTGELQQKEEQVHSELLEDVERNTNAAAERADALLSVLTKGLMDQIERLVEDLRTILHSVHQQYPEDVSMYGQLRGCMADALLRLRASAVKHFVNETGAIPRGHVPYRSRRDMCRLLDDGESGMSSILELGRNIFRAASDGLTGGLSSAEMVLWPKATMVKLLSGYSTQLEEQSRLKRLRKNLALGSGEERGCGRFVGSPFCMWLVFGLLTSIALLSFYVYTGLELIADIHDKDCKLSCRMEAIDGLVRRCLGVCAMLCQALTILVIITKIDKLDSVLMVKKHIKELQGIKQSIDQMNSELSTSTDESLQFACVRKEVLEIKCHAEAFVRKLAGRQHNSKVPLEEYSKLMEYWRSPAIQKAALAMSPSSSAPEEAVPLVAAAAREEALSAPRLLGNLRMSSNASSKSRKSQIPPV